MQQTYRPVLMGAVAALVALSILPSCQKASSGAGKVSSPGDAVAFRGKPAEAITFLSTQMNPVEEAGKMRNVILKDFPGRVDFRPNDNSFLLSEIESIADGRGKGAVLVGALHGDLKTLYDDGALEPLDDALASLSGRVFLPNLAGLSKLDGKRAYYVPWMQASFVMAANKKALPYLPKGARLETLSYEELLEWTASIEKKTGKKALGFPAGGTGLMHRFLQGYLYPSYTASTLLKFRSEEAIGMWDYLRRLWAYVNPDSLTYSSMADPLLSGDVWMAWDHTARLMGAFASKPDDFVAFPAPAGPKGRGYMIVISGLAIPKAHNGTDARLLIDYLTTPAIQTRTLRETGFFPVVEYSGQSVPKDLSSLSGAVSDQASSPGSIPVLLPVGLGERSGDYNKFFMLSFSEIVLEGMEAREVLDRNAEELQSIMNAEKAGCWLPDVSGARPCKIE